MPGHKQVETLFRQLDLVPRVGERRESELCVMSLVALLAGERHTDRPVTACPVIAAYAIKVNDTIDCDTRQDLKLLATRIMGTNDGRHGERAWLLARVCVNEVFPLLMEDVGAPPHVIASLPRMPMDIDTSFDFKQLSNELQMAGRHYGMDRSRIADFRYLLRACGRGSPEFVSAAAAITLVDSARLSPLPLAENRYWDIAVGMFDRLCDVGLGERVPGRVVEESLMTMGAQSRAETAFKPLLVWLVNGFRKLPKSA